MAKDALTVLREARELISDPKRWTQNHFARDRRGEFISPIHPEAVCFCAGGALAKVDGTSFHNSEAHSSAWEALRHASKSLFGNSDPADVNDELGHAAVLRMFDAAIASAEKEARS